MIFDDFPRSDYEYKLLSQSFQAHHPLRHVAVIAVMISIPVGKLTSGRRRIDKTNGFQTHILKQHDQESRRGFERSTKFLSFLDLFILALDGLFIVELWTNWVGIIVLKRNSDLFRSHSNVNEV
jgi:hypothetical protein